MNRAQRRAAQRIQKTEPELIMVAVSADTPPKEREEGQVYRDIPFNLTEVAQRFSQQGRTRRDLGEVLGCSDSSIGNWLNEGMCPRSIERSATLLLEEIEETSRNVYTVITTNKDERERMEAALRLAGLQFVKTEL